MNLRKFECAECGSTHIICREKLDDFYFIINYKFICKNCGSENIQYHVIQCDECHTRNLFFDEVRFEIVCKKCGLVHAGTALNIDYCLGFLLRRPNYRLS